MFNSHLLCMYNWTEQFTCSMLLQSFFSNTASKALEEQVTHWALQEGKARLTDYLQLLNTNQHVAQFLPHQRRMLKLINSPLCRLSQAMTVGILNTPQSRFI